MKMSFRDFKDTLDAIEIAYGDLDVCLLVEAGTGIDFPPLGKRGAHSFYRTSVSLVDRMKMFDNRAIKLSAKTIAIHR